MARHSGGLLAHAITRRLGVTKERRALIVAGLVVIVVLGTLTAVAISETSSSCPVSRRYVCAYVFTPVAKTLATEGEIEFKSLDTSQLSLVRISPAVARRAALAQYGRGHGSRIVFESLGGYVDKNQIVKDWIGKRSWVPKPIPSYLVRIYGAHLTTIDLSTNHYWNVIVGAVSGKIISAFTYD
jgi:hypothetical protein